MNDQLSKDMLAYGELKVKVKEIEKDMDVLKAKIMPQVEAGKKYVVGELGAIEVKKRDNWTYSAETTLLGTQLKEKQAEEIATGVATSTPTVFIDFRVKKQKENEE